MSSIFFYYGILFLTSALFVDTIFDMIPKTIDGYLKHTKTTAKQLAERLGISDSYMSMLRLGKRRPSPQLAQKIEAVTGIPFKTLLLKEGEAA